MTLPAVPATPEPSGLRRSALLMRALGARAAAVWSQLTEDEAAQLSHAMQSLPDDRPAERDIVRAYVAEMTSPHAAQAAEPHSFWQQLSTHDGTTIAELIQAESPQIIALTLSHLAPKSAADTVRILPRALATEALKRMLHLGSVHPSAVKGLELALRARLQTATTTRLSGGHENVARIFDRLDSKSEQTLLSSLNTAEPGAGEKIRAFMFTFEDLAELDAASLQTILSRVERGVLTLALKGASEPVSAAFFANMTQRAGDLMRDELDSLGAVRRGEIEAARTEIIDLARTLVKRGDILTRGQDDELIE